jgi:hypothetical protein
MSKFSCFSFGNPTNKIETAYTWGTTNSKPRGPIVMFDELEILSLSQVQFITLIFGGAVLCPFTSHGKVHEFGTKKPIS